MQSRAIPYQIIQDNQQLQQICQLAQRQSVVALDTEFERVRSYYAKLGLIQLHYGECVALIDPLAISEWQSFVELLANPQVTKVLHASGEDIEIFHQQFGTLPQPMMDTQIMANFLGFPLSVGFAKLTEHYLQISLDKGLSRTNWLKRPLSEQQLHYAAADVYYLLPIYQQMFKAAEVSPWLAIIQQECQFMMEKRIKPINPDKAYLDISNAWRLDRAALNNLKFLARWRLQEGIKRNLALNFIVDSQSLVKVAIHAPKHTSELLTLGLHPMEIKRYGKKLLLLIEQAKRVSSTDYPDLIENIAEKAGYKNQLHLLQHQLKQLLKDDLPMPVVASKKSLHQFLKWYLTGQSQAKLPELLQSWRRIYGEALLDCLHRSEHSSPQKIDNI